MARANYLYYAKGRHGKPAAASNEHWLNEMLSKSRTCATCQFCNRLEDAWFFHDDASGDVDFALAECRWREPGADGFPIVKGNDWCGCYQRNNPQEEYGL